MIPYHIKITVDSKTYNFESNEKPVKGDIYSVEESDGSSWDLRLNDVRKFLIRTDDNSAKLEYRCKAEKHEQTGTSIGFGKRN